MNANVIKQFSVYLKLQTFTLSGKPPSRGRLAQTSLVVSYATRWRWDNAKKIVFLSLASFVAFRSCCFKLFFPSSRFLWCMSIFLILFVFKFIFGCCLSLTDTRRRENCPLYRPEDGKKEKKWSHNRRNMSKRYLNTNECLKIHET